MATSMTSSLAGSVPPSMTSSFVSEDLSSSMSKKTDAFDVAYTDDKGQVRERCNWLILFLCDIFLVKCLYNRFLYFNVN